MPISRDTLIAIERAAVRSWPALETADIDGWLWRYASGGSLRANSVSALSFTGPSVEAAIGEAERRYRARGAPCRFTITEVDVPRDLDQLLERRGYERGDDHVTMVKEVSAAPAMPTDIEISVDPSPEWMAVYLTGLSANRKAIAPTILTGLPAPRMFLSCRRGGEVVGSGLTVAEGKLASVQCMATLPTARREGCARAVLAAIEMQAVAHGCRLVYLQAEFANTPAIALYEAFGFHIAGRYHQRWTERSDVPSQALRSRVIDAAPCEVRRVKLVDRAVAEARPEDVGVQALMRRDWIPHVRSFVRGRLGLEAGVDREDRPRSAREGSPAMASPPPLHECCSPGAIAGPDSSSMISLRVGHRPRGPA